jgi:hypothetical protein
MSDTTIRGLQEAQRWNARAIANMKPSGAYGRAIQNIVTQLQRYEMSVTHVDTGSLRATQRMEIRGLRGRVYIDPRARNPRSRQMTSVYGAIEEARGGSHAFGNRTVNEAAPRIVGLAVRNLGKDLT